MTMSIRRQVRWSVTLLTLTCVSPALAQKVTTVPDLTAKQVIVHLANPAVAIPVGEAIGLTSALEIGTAPFGTSSGGFTFKLDPSTGLLARTVTTFGPSFTERAITSGEGKVTAGVTFSSTSYDKLSDFSLASLPMGSTTGTTALATGTTTGNIALTNRTVAISGTVGVTDKLDVGVVVPLMSVKLAGSSSLVNGNGVVARLAETNNVFAGIGDVAAIAKFRFVKFKGPDVPDPGGMAFLVTMRLPTGDRDNLRGLGITRTMVSAVVSAGKGRLKPHGSVGFEFWNKALDAPGVSVRHQLQYAAGIELEAAPKLTLLVDFLGQEIMHGGPVTLGAVIPGSGAVPPLFAGITSTQSLVNVDDRIRKGLLIPGLKVNLKGKMVLSLNAIITLKNNGLHAEVTPVAGINLTM